MLVAVGREGEQPAEAADVTDDLGPERGADLGLDALDGRLAGRDADPGILVAGAHSLPLLLQSMMVVWTGVPGRCTGDSSSTCLRNVTGTATG